MTEELLRTSDPHRLRTLVALLSLTVMLLAHSTSSFAYFSRRRLPVLHPMRRTSRHNVIVPHSSLSSSSSSSSSSSFDEFMEGIIQQDFLTAKPVDASSDSASNAAASTSPLDVASTATSPGSKWKDIDWDALLPDATAGTSAAGTNSSLPLPPPPSPIETHFMRDRVVYLKRDDQLKLRGSQISGNKARKMLAFEMLEKYDTDDRFIVPRTVVSYGGPQSNAMLAIAAVVHYHNAQRRRRRRRRLLGGSSNNNDEDNHEFDESASSSIREEEEDEERKDRIRFVYYTKKLPRFLRNQPSGNLFRATCLGMELRELSHTDYHRCFSGGEWGSGTGHPPLLNVLGSRNDDQEEKDTAADDDHQDCLWIPQGGACGMAVAGCRELAREIFDYWAVSGRGQPLSVCLPGGTCTTAVLVHRAMKALLRSHQAQQREGEAPLDIEVVVIPCVGDEGYAQRQMMAMNAQRQSAEASAGFDTNDIPTILLPSPSSGGGTRAGSSLSSSVEQRNYFTFGEPHASIYETFRELRDEHEILVDLLYGAPAWTILLRHLDSSSSSSSSPLNGRRIMYVHSGGVEGINSQLLRYKYKNLVDVDEIQLPGKSTTQERQ
jgi:1-aminocyclopropane-1-carboxylate deaminase